MGKGNFLSRMGFFRPATDPDNYTSLEMSITNDGEVVNYPQLNLKVFFAGRCFFGGAVNMFKEAGCEPTNDINEAGLVVFLGGEDIDPALYGDKPHRTTSFNPRRDNEEVEIFLQAQALGIPCFGICRGMQFLHAMAGGVLWQHVHGHAGPDHEIEDLFSGEKMMSTSLHHQMCVYTGVKVGKPHWCIPVAKSARTISKLYVGGRSEMQSDNEMELEAAYYPQIKAFATQGHPELGRYDDYTFWCLRKIEALLNDNVPLRPTATTKACTAPYIPEQVDEELRVNVARQIG